MEEDKDNTHYVKTPILTRENWKRWFDLQRDNIEGKGIWYCIENLLKDGKLLPSGARLAEIAKHESFGKDNARCRYELRSRLSPEDADEIQAALESTCAAEIWVHLQTKYSKVLTAHAMSLVQELINFKMTEEDHVRTAWSWISQMAKRIAEVDPSEKHLKEPKRKARILLSALPPRFESTKNAIMAQPSLEGDHEQILLILESQEARDLYQKDTYAMAAYGQLTCHLCNGKHVVKECPSLDRARKAIGQGSQEPRFGSKTTSGKQKKFPGKKSFPAQRKTVKKDSLEDLQKALEAISKEVSRLKKSRKPAKAFSAEHQDETSPSGSEPESSPSDNDDTDEIAHSSFEAVGKASPSEWLLDSCASSHMTDQPHLFRSMTPVKRKKWIKVGGGWIQATHVGKA